MAVIMLRYADIAAHHFVSIRLSLIYASLICRHDDFFLAFTPDAITPFFAMGR